MTTIISSSQANPKLVKTTQKKAICGHPAHNARLCLLEVGAGEHGGHDVAAGHEEGSVGGPPLPAVQQEPGVREQRPPDAHLWRGGV